MQYVFAVLNFLMSTWGLMTLLLGFVTFFMLPMLSAITSFKVFTKLFLGLATFPLRRAAFVISESNEAYFKTLSLELGMLSTELDGETKLVEDPAQRLHHWLGIRFGLVWEENGVMFDPTDAAAGMRKRLLDEKDEGYFLATQDEWDEFGVSKWLPAVFEMPTKYEIVDLSAVKELIDGGERGEYAERVEEYYKNSRDPFGSGTPLAKFLYPVLGFCIPFFGTWFMASQFGGFSGPTSSVSFGVLWLLVSLNGLGAERVKAINWKRVVAGGLLILTPLASIAAIAYLFNPVLALSATLVFAFGLLIMPLFTIIAQASSMLAGALSKLYFKLGFLGFRRPVFVWTPAKYVVREYDALDSKQQDSITWYDMFGKVVGFSYEPEPESWGPKHMPHSEIEAEAKPKRDNNFTTDGGTTSDRRDTNLPPKYVRSEQVKRDDMGGYLPKRVKDNRYYLHTGRVLQTFKNTAVGKKSLERLLEAKQKHGDAGDGLDDSTVFKTTLVAGFLGAVSGIGIFIIPSLL